MGFNSPAAKKSFSLSTTSTLFDFLTSLLTYTYRPNRVQLGRFSKDDATRDKNLGTRGLRTENFVRCSSNFSFQIVGVFLKIILLWD